MGDATEIVLAKARAYNTAGGYVSVKAFTKDELEARDLVKAFGGNYYPHGTGWIWVLSSAEKQWSLLALLGDSVPMALDPLKERFT
jgi:hypothetical protein